MKRFTRMLVFGAAVLFVGGPVGAQTPADKYIHEAHAHKTMPSFYIGNPNHPLDASMAVHCRQLADLAAAKAARARTGWVEEPAAPAPVIKVVGRTPSPSH